MVNSETIEKIKKSRLSVVLLALFIAGLYVLQNKAVMPLVESVVESDLFEADVSTLNTKDHTSMAILQCNNFARQSIDDTHKVEFAEKPTKSWELTTGRYLISSSLIEQDENGKSIQKNFACSIQFNGGDDTVSGNWSLQGMDMAAI